MIKCNTKKLKESLAIATRCCGGTMPILSTVLIKADAKTNRVHLTSSNLDMMISTSFEAVVGEDASICIAGRRLLSIAGAIASDNTDITIGDSHRIVVKGGPSCFKIMGIGESEFPVWKRSEQAGATIVMDQLALLVLLKATEAAQSDDKSRFMLHSVLFTEEENKFVCVSTDGRRLHSATSAEAGWKDVKPSAVSSGAVATLLGLLSDTGKVQISVEESRSIRFVIERPDGEVSFISKLIEGTYPNWKQVRPKEHNLKFTIERQPFADAVRRVSLALDDKQSSIKLVFKKGNLRLSASSPTNGEADDDVPCPKSDPRQADGEYSICVNSRFLLDALQAANTESVMVKLSEKNVDVSPLVIVNGFAEAVIMPVRLS
jgi:DNA polymerase-3 subunit beta